MCILFSVKIQYLNDNANDDQAYFNSVLRHSGHPLDVYFKEITSGGLLYLVWSKVKPISHRKTTKRRILLIYFELYRVEL